MTAYVIADIDVHDQETTGSTRRSSRTRSSRTGDGSIVRGGACETLEGDWQPRRLVVIEFPSADEARRWHGSPEYAPALAMRQRASTGNLVLVEGSGVTPSAAAPDQAAVSWPRPRRRGGGPADGPNHGVAGGATTAASVTGRRGARPSVTGQRRDRRRGQYTGSRPDDEWQRRAEQQKPGGLPGLGVPQSGGSRSGGRARLRCAAGRPRRARRDPGQVRDVAVPPRLVKRRGPEPAVRPQKLSASAMCTQVSRCGSEAAYGRPSEAIPVTRRWIDRTRAIASCASPARPNVVMARK